MRQVWGRPFGLIVGLERELVGGKALVSGVGSEGDGRGVVMFAKAC